MSAQKASQCIQKWVAGDYTDDTSDDEHNEINDSASSEDDNVEKEEPAIDDDSDLSHSSDPESEVDDSAQTTADDDVLFSKDGSIRWRKKPLAAPQGRRAAPNVVHKAQSVLTPKEDVSDPRRCMEWFLDKSFLTFFKNTPMRRLAAEDKATTMCIATTNRTSTSMSCKHASAY